MNKVKIWLMALLGIVATMGFAKEEAPKIFVGKMRYLHLLNMVKTFQIISVK